MGEQIFGQIVHFLFCAFLGALFAYFIPRLSSNGYWIKGAAYGIASWFVIYAITYLFQTPHLNPVPFETAVSNFIGSIIYGLSLAWAFVWLDQRLKS